MTVKRLELIIHIEDDPLIRYTWEQKALKLNLNILSYTHFEVARDSLLALSKETYFYIDQDLGEGNKRGDEALLELYELGFRNLFLTTGYCKSDFKEYSSQFIVVGKDFPF